MSLNQRELRVALHAPNAVGCLDDPNFWNCLIDEREAGNFLGLTPRSLQVFRQRGDGPKLIKISSRCIRYRRLDLKDYADARMRNSTSDPGDRAA
jgi:hypothetical protein